MTFHTRSPFSSFGLSVENDENQLRVRKVIFVPTSYSMKTDGHMSFLSKIQGKTQI